MLRWGNSFALRLSKRDVERFGWHEGTTLRVAEVDKGQKLELEYPTFRGGNPNDGVDHDRLLYGWRLDE